MIMKKLYNPTSKDFTVSYDIKGDGQPQQFTIHSEEMESFDEPVAEHIKKHLAHQIAVSIKGKGTYEDAYKKAKRMIEKDE